MKKVKIRTIQTVIFLWAAAILISYAIILMRRMTTPNAGAIVTDFHMIVMVFGLFLFSIASIIWMLRAKKTYKGKDFLKSQIAFLDEDERGIAIHYKASEEGMRIFQTLGILMATLYILRGNFDVKLETLFICGAFLYTSYAVTYYYYLKKLYYA